MSNYRSRTLPWFFLVLAGVATLLGSGDLDGREIGDRIVLWLIAAALVAAIQGTARPTRD